MIKRMYEYVCPSGTHITTTMRKKRIKCRCCGKMAKRYYGNVNVSFKGLPTKGSNETKV